MTTTLEPVPFLKQAFTTVFDCGGPHTLSGAFFVWFVVHGENGYPELYRHFTKDGLVVETKVLETNLERDSEEFRIVAAHTVDHESARLIKDTKIKFRDMARSTHLRSLSPDDLRALQDDTMRWYAKNPIGANWRDTTLSMYEWCKERPSKLTELYMEHLPDGVFKSACINAKVVVTDMPHIVAMVISM